MTDTDPVWKQIAALDVERRAIQERIRVRARQHFGMALTDTEQTEIAGSNAYADAQRYIAIEDEQWDLLGLHDAGTNEVPPE